MNRILPALLLLSLTACEAPDIPDIPPVSIGGGGASLMTDARSPIEAYDNAYSRLTGYHLKVRQHLMSNPPHTVGAARAMEQILESLETMQALALDPWKKDLAVCAQWYRQMKPLVEGNRAGGSFETELTRRERGIKSRFNPSVVEVVAEFPDRKAEPAPQPAPVGKAPPPADLPAPAAPEVPKPAGDVPAWMLFSAWKQSHAELAEAYAKNRDAAKAYRRVREALAAMRARLPEERQKKLLLCDANYEGQHEETKGFTAAPPGGKQEDVLRVLKSISDLMEAEYDPDRK